MNVKFCLQEEYAWNAKVESEDEYTQMILLTWVQYDQYIQQTMQISVMWNHSIDFNLIYVALEHVCKGDINKTFKLLIAFEQWKFRYNKKRMNKFLKRRCCNHNVNLFCIFLSEKYKKRKAIEHAKLNIVNNGLPFVAQDRKKIIQ
ncbi:hypothetical protein RFI_34792 [Reticulomyxa filosa]|uniref:Uncharacterized protein n=1 Tax=Reticulomyxa filosa TaxID=46433 RepID=X6LML4_RETFI|nr:hypothetical protein RFI_34792 [Reticulomyxa filosa]|eukprot:ETO02626.1 hypothetical protein RFI_34792 [Reticulomyxa filosa]